MRRKDPFHVDIMALNPEVTGSCYLMAVKFPDKTATNFIVDCGLFQEEEYREYNLDFPFSCENVAFELVTHNHIDHTGRLPLLCKKGFSGNIYSTKATKILLPYALFDSQKILKKEAKRNKTKQLFSSDDVLTVCNKTIDCKYGIPFSPANHIQVTFYGNGHIPGAAMISARISYPGFENINLFFTGDFKTSNRFFDVGQIPDFVFEQPTIVISESTYGYEDSSETKKVFKDNISLANSQGKNIIVPAYALGRTQEVLYDIKCCQDENRINPMTQIWLDGKLSISYNEAYLHQDLGIREDMKDFLPRNFNYVDKTVRSSILESEVQKIIVTSSGSGSFGPAQMYIPYYISNPNALIHFTGYTPEGSLGRRLQDTEYGDSVTVHGILKQKFANVMYTKEYSAHAKADEIISFLSKFQDLKLLVFNHGAYYAKDLIAQRAMEEIRPKEVALLGRDYVFGVNPFGLAKAIPTSYK